MALSEDLHQIPRLFGDAVEQLGKLVQNETNLAKAELSLKIAEAAKGAAFLGLAAVLFVPVLVLLLMAIALWLTASGFSPVTSHFLAALIGAALAVVFALIGRSYLQFKNLKLKVTMRQVEQDVATAKELVR